MYIYEDFTHLFSYKDYLIYVQLWRIYTHFVVYFCLELPNFYL